MNNPNPFVPQGSLVDQMNKKRARFKIAVFSSLGLFILVITPLLIQGCSKDKDKSADGTGLSATNSVTDTNMPDTNLTAQLPPMPATNTTPVVTNTPPPPTPQPDIPTTKEYVVAKNDSFYTIAKKFGVKIKELEAANPGIAPTKLKVGQKLQIPAPSSAGTTTTVGGGTGVTDAVENSYVVKSGDSLTKIAKQHGVSLRALRTANELKTDKIKVGQKLKIPAKTMAADTTTTPTPSATEPAPTATSPTNGTGR